MRPVMNREATATPRPTPRQVSRELAAVVADLPTFVGAPLFRSRHLRWGATPVEVARAMPGDGWVPGAQYRTTRAITIDAPPEAVWPWLVQVGCLRAGFYSDDLLDNLAHPSATTVIPELQHLQVGQWVPMSPAEPSDRTAFKVASFVENQSLLWARPDSTWSWELTELSGGRTRLVTRVRARYDWSHPFDAALGVLLMELGDFAMMRRMLRGIKMRAESLASRVSEHSDGMSASLWRPWTRAWLGVLAWAFRQRRPASNIRARARGAAGRAAVERHASRGGHAPGSHGGAEASLDVDPRCARGRCSVGNADGCVRIRRWALPQW